MIRSDLKEIIVFECILFRIYVFTCMRKVSNHDWYRIFCETRLVSDFSGCNGSVVVLIYFNFFLNLRRTLPPSRENLSGQIAKGADQLFRD